MTSVFTSTECKRKLFDGLGKSFEHFDSRTKNNYLTSRKSLKIYINSSNLLYLMIITNKF